MSNLSIKTEKSDDGNVFTLTLSGQVDVTAGTALDAIEEIPAEGQVIMDFEAVDRINSMGLAQLMKLLERWKQNKVGIEAKNLNRMISMLFKMTGLNRYFASNQQNAVSSAKVANGQPERQAPNQGIQEGSTPGLRQVRRIRAVKDQSPAQGSGNKLQFSVSLQSNQQLTGWYFFNTLLQRRLEKSISMDVKQPGQEAKLHENALVYAKPFDACALIEKHGFIPIARPMNDTDEVSIIVQKNDASKKMADFDGVSVVTAMQANFVYLLGRFLCDECDLDSSKLSYTFTGNEIKALQTLLKGQADMLFMLKKNYHELSKLSREDTALLDESETSMAYHMLLLSPHYESYKSSLTQTLLNLQDDEKGAQVLNDLGLQGWVETEDDEINMLLMLYNRYVENSEVVC